MYYILCPSHSLSWVECGIQLHHFLNIVCSLTSSGDSVKWLDCRCACWSECLLYEPPARLTTKPTKLHVHPAKTQISLGICPVWSVFTLRSIGSWGPTLKTQTRLGRCPGWVFAEHTGHFVGFVMWRLICLLVRIFLRPGFFTSLIMAIYYIFFSLQYVSSVAFAAPGVGVS